MLNLATGTSTLEVLLRETGVVTGAVLATSRGEVLGMTGSVRPGGDDLAAVSGLLASELATIGAILGLGEFHVATMKGEGSARVFALQGEVALAIEVDARRPLAELEAKLRSSAWSGWTAPAAPALASKLAATPARPSAATIPRATIPLPQGSAPRQLRAQPPPPPPPPPPSSSSQSAGPEEEAATVRTRTAVITRPRPPRAEGSSAGQTKVVGNESAFAGQLEEFALPDLLEFMRNGVRTGLLTCISDAGVGTVQLVRGLIVSAESPHAHSLRDQLVTSTALPPERRREIERLPATAFHDQIIDAALVETKLLSADEVELARVARVYDAFREMITWAVGRFSFEPGGASDSPKLALTAQSVLLQIFQEQDEQAR